MPERDVEKMIGGYASGTLTPEERRLLFEAALHDQNVFDALAEDQALKDLLDDPAARRRVLDAMRSASAGSASRWLSRTGAWLRQPGRLALAGSLAAAVLVSLVVIEVYRQGVTPPSEEPRSTRLREADGPAMNVAPRAAQPEAKPDRKLRAQKSAPAAKAVPRRPHLSRAAPSFGKRSKEGPARSLFYAGREEEEVGLGGAALEDQPVSPSQAPGLERERMFERSEQMGASMTPLGLRYRIVEDQPGAPELRIETNRTGYLYVLELTEGGATRLLFPELSSSEPAKQSAGTEALVQPGVSYAIKLEGRLESLKDRGSYRVVAMVSRQPLSRFASEPTTSVDRRLLDEARRTGQEQALLIEEVAGEGGAVYVVNPSASESAVISVTITFERDRR